MYETSSRCRSVLALTLLAAGIGVAPAHAQSVNGTAFLSARCSAAGDLNRPIGLDDDFVVTRHGECAAPRFGGLASINDASCSTNAGRLDFLIDIDAHTDFFGTRDDAGTASASANFAFSAGDLVFTDVANPSDPGPVQVSLNLVFRARVASQGQSNCNPFQPAAGASFFVGGAGGTTSGVYTLSAGQVTDINGVFVGYPNDGSSVVLVSPGSSVGLGTPQQLNAQVSCNGGVLYCDFPPGAVGDAASMLAVAIPRTGPVFNLPPGITVNSPSLHIVNNNFRAPCVADFNGDGAVTSQDFFDFLTAFFAAGPRADINADGAVNSQDFFDFLTAFFAGC